VASIAKRETNRGVRYDVRYRLPAGQVRTKTHRTRKEAERFAAITEADKARGGIVDPRAGRATLAEYAAAWIDGKPELRPRTVDLYEGLLRLHVLPELGETPLGRLDGASIRAWRAKKLRTTSAGTVAKAYRVHTAVVDGLIVANPCQIKKGGAEHHAERPVVGPAEVWSLADAVAADRRCMVLLAGFCALRLGEVLALAVRHVDLFHGTLTVERQLQEIGKSGEQTFTAPKSDRGRRTLVLPGVVAGELRAHLEAMSDASPDALLFTGAKGGPLRRPRWNQEWNAAKASTGNASLHYHDLRHSAMTLFAATGATIAELQAQAGHASPVAAMKYQHATQDRAAALAQLVDRVITAPSEPTSGSVRAMDAR